MSGILTIHSSGTGQLLSGHSWIEYTPDGGKTITYGTWGNNPTGQGNGLFENLELGRTSDASRSTRISDAQEAKLMEVISKYKAEGSAAWKYLNPCSGFAEEAWEAATGERLAHRSGIISNPSKLKDSINAANAKDAKKAKSDDEKPSPNRPSSSINNVGAPISSCPKESKRVPAN